MKNYSQNNEQDIILNYLNNNNLKSGTFLDIGAFDGETYSNTRGIMLAFQEWKGIFIEPSSYSFYKLFQLYQNEPHRAALLNIAVVLETELDNNLLEFYDSPTHSAASSKDIKNVNRFIAKLDDNGNCIDPRKIFIGKIGLKYVLQQFNNTNFQFINIDVEGGSAQLALQDWFNPLNNSCKLLCVEHDNMQLELFNKFSKKLGYNLIAHNAENLIFGK